MTIVTVFGGTGFLGRPLVRRLAIEQATVRVAVRNAELARTTLRADGLGGVAVFRADVREPDSLVAALAGADAVVNAVSAYVEKGGMTFEGIHVQGAEAVARKAAEAGLARLVLISGIGADPSSASCYIRARGRGELAVQRAFPGATIVRPSAMFGPGDALFGTLADIARLLPVLPLIGGAHTRLQPVYVQDVVEAVCRMLINPQTTGRTYELVGPRTYTMRELVLFTLRLAGKRRPLITVPFMIASSLARLFELLPNPPLTTSQVDLLRSDNAASGVLPGFQDLGIRPEAVEEVVPTYISRSHTRRNRSEAP
jgi:NADH dehydrogenase